MKLSAEENAMLAGEFGLVPQIVIQHQIKVGSFVGAHDFVPVSQAHVMADRPRGWAPTDWGLFP